MSYDLFFYKFGLNIFPWGISSCLLGTSIPSCTNGQKATPPKEITTTTTAPTTNTTKSGPGIKNEDLNNINICTAHRQLR